jgi:hypothetical protein
MVGNGFSHSIEPTDATLAAVKEMLRRAWLTLLTIENTSRGPAPPRTAWPAFPGRCSNTAYAATPLSVRTFTVTAGPHQLPRRAGVVRLVHEPHLDPQVAPIPERIETVKIFKAWCAALDVAAAAAHDDQPAATGQQEPRLQAHRRHGVLDHDGLLARDQRMLKTFRVDRVYEVDQKPASLTQAAPLPRERPGATFQTARSSTALLTRSLLPFDHPDAVAAHRGHDQAAADEKQRRARRQQQASAMAAKPEGTSKAVPARPGDQDPSPAAFKSAA